MAPSSYRTCTRPLAFFSVRVYISWQTPINHPHSAVERCHATQMIKDSVESRKEQEMGPLFCLLRRRTPSREWVRARASRILIELKMHPDELFSRDMIKKCLVKSLVEGKKYSHALKRLDSSLQSFDQYTAKKEKKGTSTTTSSKSTLA